MIPYPFLTLQQIELLRSKLAYSGEVAFSRVKFSDLIRQIERDGEEIVAMDYLLDDERQKFGQFNRAKRRVEWLSGRLAAKHAIHSLQKETGFWQKEAWHDYHILIEKSGRPYLAPGKNVPDISISHSGSIAVAMACSKGRCGIDIQEITEKIFRVEKKFATKEETVLYQQDARELNVNYGEFLTLLWAAKEALRKGIEVAPIAGFLKLQLVAVSGERDEGIMFTFVFSRDAKDLGSQLFQTYQIVDETSALAIFIG